MAETFRDLNWNIDDPITDPVQDDPIDPVITDPVDPGQSDTTPPTDPGEGEGNVNPIYQFLQKRGIEDPSKIKFENDNGELEDYDFSSLTPEEQLSILEEVANPGLSEHETEVVNYLRQNNTNFDQVIDYFAEKRLQEYLEQNPDQVRQQVYSIDDFSDEELYLADLKSKFTSFTDEELTEKLSAAKLNEDLFKKEVDILRLAYKAEEDQERELEKQQEDQYYEDLRNNLVEVASHFNEISLDYNDPESDSLVIEDGDKRQILSYLLNQDADGRSQFVKDLDDPQVLIELAWYRTQGADVISGITKY